MPLDLAQSDEMVRSGWWRWSVWMDGTDEELDQVKEVTYLLHPSFPDPVCVVSDRSSSFRISTAGWGEFTIHAEARLRDGSVQKFRHPLKLHTPEQHAAPPDTPHIFLSYSAIDGRLAAQVSRELESHGVKVINSGSTVSSGSPADTTRMVMENSHAVVALQSDTPSNAVQAELSRAQDLNKPIVHVQVGAAPSDAAPRGNVLHFGANVHGDTIGKKVIQLLEPMTKLPSGGTTIISPLEKLGSSIAVETYKPKSTSTSTRKATAAQPGLVKKNTVSRSASTGKTAASKSKSTSKTAAARSASTGKTAAKRSTNTLPSRRGR